MHKVFAAGLLLALSAWSQETKAPVPDLTGDEIIQKFIDATGGAAARQKLKSSVVKGQMELGAQGMRGSLEIYSKAPNKRLTITKIDGMGEMSQGFDGTTAWAKDPQGNVREIAGPQLAVVLRESQFNSDLRWKELYEKVETQGKGKIDGKDAWVVKITPKAGAPMVRYYDAETFLLLRSDMTVNGPQGEFTLKTSVSDYREIDGVKVPFQLTQGLPMGTMGMRVSEIKNNVPIDDAMFAKPAAPVPAAPAAPAAK
jgi:hypothetical protein